MQMIVSGMKDCTDRRGFKALFGRYVYGFNPWTHCDWCLKSRTATAITPKMTDGSYKLADRLFYLCGVGQKVSSKSRTEHWQRQTNVHLAVRPRKGSVASVGSVYGVTFVIEDAQAIPIVKREVLLVSGSKPGAKHHVDCRMFQFGYQMFEAGPISFTNDGRDRGGEFVHLLRKDALPWLGRQDTDRIMVDPGLESKMLS